MIKKITADEEDKRDGGNVNEEVKKGNGGRVFAQQVIKRADKIVISWAMKETCYFSSWPNKSKFFLGEDILSGESVSCLFVTKSDLIWPHFEPKKKAEEGNKENKNKISIGGRH